MTKMTVAELEVIFDANTARVDTAEKKVTATAKKIEGKPIVATVDGDAKGALGSMDRVEEQAKRLVSAKTVATVDANIERAQKSFDRVTDRLEYLRSVAPNLEVTADIKRAETQLNRAQRQLDGLKSARAVMEVDADTSAAEDALEGATDAAGEAGDDAGSEFGKNIIAALVSIPIAGAVIGVGVAAGKALLDGFNDGLQQEASFDRLQALTGIDEAAALRLGRAAGEAYANNFGDSIESNMDISRLALQFDIIDETATTRDAQKVVQGLAGIADVLGEDVQPVARAVTQLLRTGLASSAEEAFDILATGQREGANLAEDLLDTMSEYASTFSAMGLTGGQALGLINQGLRAGAPNSDFFATALQELGIRIREGDDATSGFLDQLDLVPGEMRKAFIEGGPAARDALDAIFDRLRDTDPIDRNRIAVGLLGTQFEDLQLDLTQLDLSNAEDQLNGVTGSAQRMFDTLADNDASKMEQAQRNIEVATDGIKGALAAAFSEPLGDFADWVSQNRGPVLQFFSDMVNGAIDFGITANESFGSFVSGPLAETIDGLAGLIDWMNGFEGRPKELDELAESMRGFESVTDDVSDKLEGMRGGFNVFMEGQIALGYVNDAALRTASAVAEVGSEHGTMEGQVRAAVAALQEEISTAAAAGETQESLTDRYNAATEALVGQLTQMGLTEQEARDLIAAYGAVPELVETTVTANTSQAQADIDRFIALNATKRVNVAVGVGGTGGLTLAQGGIVEFMAQGGIPGLTPMAPVAQMVPPSTWRVVGDRGDVPELYAPLDGSARSWALILEGLRRMPGTPPQLMAEGGITGPAAAPVAPAVYVQNPFTGEYLLAKTDARADARIRAADDAAARSARQGLR